MGAERKYPKWIEAYIDEIKQAILANLEISLNDLPVDRKVWIDLLSEVSGMCVGYFETYGLSLRRLSNAMTNKEQAQAVKRYFTEIVCYEAEEAKVDIGEFFPTKLDDYEKTRIRNEIKEIWFEIFKEGDNFRKRFSEFLGGEQYGL